MRALIVDDSVDRQRALERVLKHKGAEVAQALNFEEALNKLYAEKFDLVYLDHDLGQGFVKSGDQLVDAILGLPQDSRPRAVAVHTSDSVIGRDMVGRLKEAGIEATYRPFEG